MTIETKAKIWSASTPANDGRNSRFVWLVCFVAAMGGLLFGYDWVVIGGAKPFYEPYFGISDSPVLQGWAMSSALLGCLVGAVISGILADQLGRKQLLIFSALLFTVSAIGTALAWDFSWFNIFRIVGGVGIGLASNLSPMYIAEVAPAKSRGRLVSINQLAIVIGILAAQVTNLMIAREVADDATVESIRLSWNGTVGWRWMFGAGAIPAVIFLLLMFLVPESPRWLVQNGDVQTASAVLTKIGGAQHAAITIDEIRGSLGDEEASKVSLAEIFEPRSRRVLLLGVLLAVFQQWCGINVIFNYAQEVFSAAGYGVGAIMFNIVITGLVNLAFTFIAIATVDRFGRRGLMLVGSAGLAIIYGVLGTCFFFESRGVHMLILVVSAIACYAMSLAPIVWVVISEIFPNRIRGGAMAISVFCLWLACAALTFTFPLLNQTLGAHGTFWLYGGICVFGFFVVYFQLPETKGQSLEAIENEFAR